MFIYSFPGGMRKGEIINRCRMLRKYHCPKVNTGDGFCDSFKEASVQDVANVCTEASVLSRFCRSSPMKNSRAVGELLLQRVKTQRVAQVQD